MTKTTEVQSVNEQGSNVQTTALAVLDPKTFVAQVYEPFRNRLKNAIAETVDVTYDIKTPSGMEVAKKSRALFRDIRTQGENERKAKKAPILEIGKLLDSEYKSIADEIEPYEQRFDADIKAEEERKEQEKAARILAEEQRKAAIQTRMDIITQAPLKAIAMSSADTQALIDELSGITPSEAEYGERFVEAEVSLKAAIVQLNGLLDGKKAQEAMAEQLAKQQAESNRTAAIQLKITDIRNMVMSGADCDTSEQLQQLIEKTEAISITADVYQEFAGEAQAAKDKVLAALRRQVSAMQFAEREEVNASAPAAPASPAEAEPMAQAAVQADKAQPEPVATKPASNVRYFSGARPTKAEITDAVAKAFAATPELAEQWIRAEFGLAKAA